MDPFRPSQGYRQLSNDGDPEIEFWAPTQEGVLLIGALALVEMMTGDPAPQHPGVFDADDERQVGLDAADPTDRLVRWLNEVVNAARAGLLLRHADIVLSDSGMSGRIYGDHWTGDSSIADPVGTVIGDGAELTQHDYGWYARVALRRIAH